jgi:hypothetical protein
MVFEHDQLILIPKVSFSNFGGINATEPEIALKYNHKYNPNVFKTVINNLLSEKYAFI